MLSMHQSKASSSVYPSRAGSTPPSSISRVNDLTVPHRPELRRIDGMPISCASSMHRSVWSIFFWRVSEEGETNP